MVMQELQSQTIKQHGQDFINGEVSNKIMFEFPEVINANWNTTTQPMYLFIATSATGTGDDIKYYVELTGTDKKLLQVGATARFPIGIFKIKCKV